MMSKWISFAPSNSDASSARTSEEYLLSPGGAISSPRVRYVRYGDAPSWYSVHNPCRIEMTGRRHLSLSTIPSDTLNLFKAVSPRALQTSESLESRYNNEIDPLSKFKPWYKNILDHVLG